VLDKVPHLLLVPSGISAYTSYAIHMLSRPRTFRLLGDYFTDWLQTYNVAKVLGLRLHLQMFICKKELKLYIEPSTIFLPYE